MKLTIKQIAEKIGMPIQDWKGNCATVAERICALDEVGGEVCLWSLVRPDISQILV